VTKQLFCIQYICKQTVTFWCSIHRTFQRKLQVGLCVSSRCEASGNETSFFRTYLLV